MRRVSWQQLQCLADLATEVKAVFGEGGNAEAPIVEEYIGFVNSPIQNGYVRVLIGKAFGMALEYIQDHGGSEHAELINVEWGGQEMVQGSLEINFREPNYLWMILAMKDVPTRSDDIKDIKKTNFCGRKNIYAGDNPVAKMRDARLNYEALMGAGSGMASQRANTLKELYTIDNRSAAETLFGRDASDYAHNFFDIVIGYGDGYAGDNPNRIGEKIINCTIMGRAKQIEASGQPIREVYTFIGQKHI